jgi:hypothetical protein
MPNVSQVRRNAALMRSACSRGGMPEAFAARATLSP